MPYGKPVYLRPASRGSSRWKFFVGGVCVGGLLVFFGMSAWYAHRPVEVVVQSSPASATQNTIPANLAADYVWSEGGYVGIKEPAENTTADRTFTVSGLANPSDAKVTFKITELVRGKVVVIGTGEAVVKSTVAGTHGTFTATIGITPSREQGTLEVSVQTNAPDHAVDTVVIPLKFVVHKETPTPKPASSVDTSKPAAVPVP